MSIKPIVYMALPKGRMEKGVLQLLSEAEVQVIANDVRTYRPFISLPAVDVKLLKPQNIIEMLEAGSRDFGFAGADWVAELEANVVELLDTGLNPVQLVAAAPNSFLENGRLPQKSLRIASGYERLSKKWMKEKELDAKFIRSYGATEAFPPEDADCIVDNTATGATLQANNLQIIDKLLSSSTRLYANPRALENPEKKEMIEDLVLVLKSVLEARSRVMLELNVSEEDFQELINVVPCMKSPTVSKLYGDVGYAINVAVLKKDLPQIIPLIKSKGGTDIIVFNLKQIVP